ncbi:EYxxD motif small membrane protein [Bacillus sp. V3-13]
MFLEYISDVLFVLITLIGSIVALVYVYVRKTNKKRAR